MCPSVYVTRIESFSSAHRLYSTDLTEEENERIFGKCSGKNGHGHNFKCEVTVFGEINPTTGMVINIQQLKEIIRTEVLELLDHKNLDLDVPHFRENNLVSTSENLVVFIWNSLRAALDPELKLKVKLHETEKNIVCYHGE